jgi:uncharacterized protein (DUF302 family)
MRKPLYLALALGAIVICMGTIVPWCWTAIDGVGRNAPTIGYSEAMGDDAMATDGLTIVPSSFGAKETMDRLEAEVKAKGLTVFARVDHAAGAAAVGMQLRPTELLIFGNARGGTPLMQVNQVAGIDLPLKALVYQDSAGKVWLAYNNPDWIARRHELGARVAPNVEALSKALDALAWGAAKAQ